MIAGPLRLPECLLLLQRTLNSLFAQKNASPIPSCPHILNCTTLSYHSAIPLVRRSQLCICILNSTAVARSPHVRIRIPPSEACVIGVIHPSFWYFVGVFVVFVVVFVGLSVQYIQIDFLKTIEALRLHVKKNGTICSHKRVSEKRR